MGAIYISREGACATVNVWANLATLGSAGTVNAIVVPEGYNSIKQLKVVFTRSSPADTSGGMGLIRLKGSGVKYGPCDFVVGGMGGEETGSDSYVNYMLPLELSVDIAVKPGGEIWIQGAQTGTDWGTAEFGVTAVFGGEQASERYYMSRTGIDTSAVDTDFAATTLVDETAGPFQIPSSAKKIYSLVVGVGTFGLVGPVGGTQHVRIRGTGLPGGEQVITAGGCGALSTTQGVSGGYQVATQIPTDLELRGGGQIQVLVAQTGVDAGTPNIGITLEVGP